jgi:hypothetical protein
LESARLMPSLRHLADATSRFEQAREYARTAVELAATARSETDTPAILSQIERAEQQAAVGVRLLGGNPARGAARHASDAYAALEDTVVNGGQYLDAPVQFWWPRSDRQDLLTDLDRTVELLGRLTPIRTRSAAVARIEQLAHEPLEPGTPTADELYALTHELPRGIRVAPPRSMSRLEPERGASALLAQLRFDTQRKANMRLTKLLAMPTHLLKIDDLREIRALLFDVDTKIRPNTSAVVKRAALIAGEIDRAILQADPTAQYVPQLLVNLRAERAVGSARTAQQRIAELAAKDPIDLEPDDVREAVAITASIAPERQVRLDTLPSPLRDIVRKNTLGMYRPDYGIVASIVDALAVDTDELLPLLQRIASREPNRLHDLQIAELVARDPGLLTAAPPRLTSRILDSLIATAGNDTDWLDPISETLSHVVFQARQMAGKHANNEFAQQLHDDIHELGNRNIERIDGYDFFTSEETEGYLNFPDFAEIGDLQSAFRMLIDLDDPQAVTTTSNTVTW